MGDRYILKVICPKCKFKDNEVYYAPTCGFVDWKCPKCQTIVDLAEYSGITYEEASNKEIIDKIINSIKRR